MAHPIDSLFAVYWDFCLSLIGGWIRRGNVSTALIWGVQKELGNWQLSHLTVHQLVLISFPISIYFYLLQILSQIMLDHYCLPWIWQLRFTRCHFIEGSLPLCDTLSRIVLLWPHFGGQGAKQLTLLGVKIWITAKLLLSMSGNEAHRLWCQNVLTFPKMACPLWRICDMNMRTVHTLSQFIADLKQIAGGFISGEVHYHQLLYLCDKFRASIRVVWAERLHQAPCLGKPSASHDINFYRYYFFSGSIERKE